MNMHSKLLNNHSVHPPLSAGEGFNLQPNFQKGGGGGELDRTSSFREGLLGNKEVIYSGGGVAIFT